MASAVQPQADVMIQSTLQEEGVTHAPILVPMEKVIAIAVEMLLAGEAVKFTVDMHYTLSFTDKERYQYEIPRDAQFTDRVIAIAVMTERLNVSETKKYIGNQGLAAIVLNPRGRQAPKETSLLDDGLL